MPNVKVSGNYMYCITTYRKLNRESVRYIYFGRKRNFVTEKVFKPLTISVRHENFCDVLYFYLYLAIIS